MNDDKTADQLRAETAYAKRLAVAMWRDHYKDSSLQWEPFDDMYGILSQIDNMLTGLKDTRADSGEAVAWQYRNVTDEGPSPFWHEIDKAQFDLLRNDPHAEVRELFTHPRATAVDVRDAERYRFIRQLAAGDPFDFNVIEDAAFASVYGNGHNFDHNIDAAIASREVE